MDGGVDRSPSADSFAHRLLQRVAIDDRLFVVRTVGVDLHGEVWILTALHIHLSGDEAGPVGDDIALEASVLAVSRVFGGSLGGGEQAAHVRHALVGVDRLLEGVLRAGKGVIAQGEQVLGDQRAPRLVGGSDAAHPEAGDLGLARRADNLIKFIYALALR